MPTSTLETPPASSLLRWPLGARFCFVWWWDLGSLNVFESFPSCVFSPMYFDPSSSHINIVARIGNNRVFLTSTCQNALRFVIFQISNFVNETTKSLQRLFFHLASARYVSLGHVVAIDPLIDCIPESGIDSWLLGQCGFSFDWGNFFWDVANNDQFIGFLQLSFFPALAPSESIHYACGPRTSPPCFW